MGTKQLDFSKDTDDDWMEVVAKLRERQRVMQLELGEEEREGFKPAEGPGITEKIKCLQAWGVPERILKNLFSEESPLKATKAVEWVREFSLQPREAWCLVLSGGKGTGKSTGAAVWLHDNVPIDGAPTYTTRYWWSGTRIARTNGYAKDFEKMLQHKFMVIDDLGVEYLDKNGNFLQRLERVTDRLREGFAYGGGFYEIADDSMRARR